MTDKVIFTNTQGFQNKTDKLNELVTKHQPLALVVAEHFQADSKDLNKINGYVPRASYCRDAKERGGVAVYVKEGEDCTRRTDLDPFCKKWEFEAASVEIPSRNLVVTGVYRPPNSKKTTFNSKMDDVLKMYSKETDKKHLITGDFNIDVSKANRTGRVLMDNGFKSTLNESTHDYGACLDNAIVDFKPSKTRVMRDKIEQVSDHNPIEVILPSKKIGAAKNRDQVSQLSKEIERMSISTKQTGKTSAKTPTSKHYFNEYTSKSTGSDAPKKSSNSSSGAYTSSGARNLTKATVPSRGTGVRSNTSSKTTTSENRSKGKR